MPAKELDDVKATARRIAIDKINTTKAIEAHPMPDSLVERLRETDRATLEYVFRMCLLYGLPLSTAHKITGLLAEVAENRL